MAIYGYGAEENKLNNANEAMGELATNKSIIVQKLTDMEDPDPEEVRGLETIEDVFDYYKPSMELDFEDAEGGTVSEEIRFNNLGDFGKKGLTNGSQFLKGLQEEEDQNLKLVKALKSNKSLQKALQDPEARKAFAGAVSAMLAELEEAGV
jgi:hypothetical protein